MQLSELYEVDAVERLSNFRYPSAKPPKSPFYKGFPSPRALTVVWAHSYSVRKWRKVAQSGFLGRKTLKIGETLTCFAEPTLSVSMPKAG